MEKSLMIGMITIFSYGCNAQNGKHPVTDAYYEKHKGDSLPSKSTGTYSKGELINGKMMPFHGTNFTYFSETSYLSGRAYVNLKVKNSVLGAYSKLEKAHPGRMFGLMECSNKKGGKLWPHHTHQNGLSVDFMMPLIKDGKPYYKLDDDGPDHYLLSFNDQGQYCKDTTISIDFNLVAQHILLLDEQARKNGLHVKKVIIKIELKDELFATPYGKKLKAKGIYVVQALTPQINDIHDDHFHIDFEGI
ncbi:MAG: penicillin-insensitive murein endopeptidase [Bacteroidetes bacterium]|nr:penicillin-insensitive murein endopeptidase [Bacteroidota bacterium]